MCCWEPEPLDEELVVSAADQVADYVSLTPL